MSFKNKHLHIDRNNYEEYFLMYVDHELTHVQRLAVEEFIINHPDLKEELALLSATVLDAEPIRLFDKESLLSHHILQDVVDEQLLMYLDNELSREEAAKVEIKLSSDTNYKIQYEGLLKTRLHKDDIITYPYKKELYRTENERSIRPFFILRIAAAVVILLTSALFYIFSSDVTNEPPVIVQQTIKPQQQKENIADQNSFITTDETIEANRSEETQIVIASEKNNVEKKSVANNQSITHQVPTIDNEHIAHTEFPKVEKQNTIDANIFQQQNINNQPVTTIEVPAYTKVDASETLVPGLDAFDGDEDKKGSVRGFLRKATRFIERRTGINAVNEDDELLIGAVAIKLK
ncbi:MAG: hypothetical protein H0V91_04220 [Flavisolibacter sp.]|nr:hypothetical protein [Flavisolibacter sp.]